jgi:group I intron endonuclease
MLDTYTSIYNLSTLTLPKSQRPILCGIYRITNPSGSVYIGESKDILKRWRAYKGKYCKRQPRLYESLNKHTPENHIFEIVELCEFEELKNKERLLQEHYINQGYILGRNLMNGKLTPTTEKKETLRIVSDETKTKMSISQLGNKNHMYGKHHSEQRKKQISECQSGNKHYMYGKGTKIRQFDYKTNTFIKEGTINIFIKEGFDSRHISKCILHPETTHSHKGFKWVKVEDVH